MKVLTGISGSRVIVMFDNGDYIDARTVRWTEEWNRIEAVKNGHVVDSMWVSVDAAPRVIVRLIKDCFSHECYADR